LWDAKEKSGKYVFIIDEINRGNISKIFGELITLIEPSKRDAGDNPEKMQVTLPYSKKSFSVPDNVYIIGTMNTADRSISLIDTALRRRFVFREMLPRPELLKDIKVNNIDISYLLAIMNERIVALYDREHTIGHSFFFKLKENPEIVELGNIFKNEIIPLLQEYFYDDYEKIQLILGDNQKEPGEPQFVIKETAEVNIDTKKKELFGEVVDKDINLAYLINNGAFEEEEAYKYLIKPKQENNE
jgi:5-methylcytosine-specific restriction protein B